MLGIELISSKRLDILYDRVNELTKQRNDARERLATVIQKRGATVDGLVSDLRASREAVKGLTQYAKAVDEARMSLGEKNKALREQATKSTLRIAELERALTDANERYETLKHDYDELSSAHELLISAMKDASVEVCQ